MNVAEEDAWNFLADAGFDVESFLLESTQIPPEGEEGMYLRCATHLALATAALTRFASLGS